MILGNIRKKAKINKINLKLMQYQQLLNIHQIKLIIISQILMIILQKRKLNYTHLFKIITRVEQFYIQI